MSTVLVGEDDADISLLANFILTRAGHRAVHADNGEAALDLLAAEPVDLVLLDIRLPGVDGWEVLKRIRNSENLHDLPVVMVSAHTTPSTFARALQAGSQGYLVKPFDEQALLNYVDELT